MRRSCLLLIIVSTVLMWAAPALEAFAEKRIMVIHSYHLEHVSMFKRNSGLQKILNPVQDIHVKYFYMDTKRKSGLVWKQQVAKLAHAKIAAFKPDIIILFDDNAQKYVAPKYLNLNHPQIVFAGVNGEPEAYGYPALNATGILERTYPDQTLSMLAKIDSNIKKVVCLSDDSATANGVVKFMRANKMPLEIEAFEQPKTFHEWKEVALRYERDPNVHAFLVPLYHTVKVLENSDARVPPNEVMRWMTENIRKPIAGLYPFSTQDGALCAITVDLTEHGVVAAKMALRILNGEKAGHIPIEKNNDGYVILNAQTAKRLGIFIPGEIRKIADKIIE